MRIRKEIQAVPRQACVTVVLVRHGESEANIARCINDDPLKPVNLTDLGRQQAESVDVGCVDFAYASEFPRAQQTASIILRKAGIPLHVDSRINERRSGMDGMPVHLFNEKMKLDPVHFKPMGGESFHEEMIRVGGFLDEMAIRHPGKRILAVSHENPILAALAAWGKDPMEAALGAVANCEAIEIIWPRS